MAVWIFVIAHSVCGATQRKLSLTYFSHFETMKIFIFVVEKYSNQKRIISFWLNSHMHSKCILPSSVPRGLCFKIVNFCCIDAGQNGVEFHQQSIYDISEPDKCHQAMLMENLLFTYLVHTHKTILRQHTA